MVKLSPTTFFGVILFSHLKEQNKKGPEEGAPSLTTTGQESAGLPKPSGYTEARFSRTLQSCIPLH
jgi:hypothetical protein